MAGHSQLSIDERKEIHNCLNQNLSIRSIAKLLRRAPSTISREIKRNAGCGVRGYSFLKAERLSNERRRLKQSKVERFPELKSIIKSMLSNNESPEMIAGRMKHLDKEVTVSTETIYKYIYSYEGVEQGLWKKLCRHRPRRGAKISRKNRKPLIKDRISIDERPLSIGLMMEAGHYEGDLIFAHGSQTTAIVVLVEKKTRFALLAKVNQKTTQEVTDSMIKKLSKLPKEARKSATFDNGSEFSAHSRLRDELGMQTFFCHPHSPWEKGQVESTNAILRRYVPRGSSIQKLSDDNIEEIERRLNSLPRKCLGFKTPMEAFNEVFI